MSAAEIIAECERRGVRLSLGETFDVLNFDAPAGAMTRELHYQLAEHKSEIIEELFDREERAALMGAPEWVDAKTFLHVVNHPAVLMLQSLGLCDEIISVRPRIDAQDEREAAA